MQTDVKISQQLIQGVVFKLCYRKVYRTDFISCIQRVKFVSQPATTRTVCRVGDMDHLIRNDPDSTLLRENKSLGCNIQILSFFFLIFLEIRIPVPLLKTELFSSYFI